MVGVCWTIPHLNVLYQWSSKKPTSFTTWQWRIQGGSFGLYESPSSFQKYERTGSLTRLRYELELSGIARAGSSPTSHGTGHAVGSSTALAGCQVWRQGHRSYNNIYDETEARSQVSKYTRVRISHSV